MLPDPTPGDDVADADLLFVNGPVYTVDAVRSWAQAVAVKGERIVAVGTDAELTSLAGDRTEVVDLHGRLLLPGFQDAHVHPVSGGVDMLQCDLHDLDSAEACLAAIRAYAASHPEEPWILGGGWSMDSFPGGTPTKEPLDAVVADRPVYLPNRDGHSGWVNSAALRISGITRDTPDPRDGRIERTQDGEPSGTLHEGAQSLVARHAPGVNAEDMYRGLLAGQRYLHSLGITAWQDAIVETDDEYDNYGAYLQADREGALTGRVVGALWWDRHRGLEQIQELIEKREAARAAGRFAATTVKIMQDGVCENFTGAVLESYLDAHGDITENRGISFVDPPLLNEAVIRLDAEGFQVHFHVIAERAVREALDAIEAARTTNGPSDGRHHLAHIQVIHPNDVARFRRLGVVANAQPLWAAHEAQMDELTIPFLGEPRWRWQYPFASLVRAGTILAMGSDWPVSSPDPLEEIHVAVNRKMSASYPYRVDTDDVFLPDERLDLPTAVGAFTMGSAYVDHRDADTGSIETGKLADLVVVDRNVFAGAVGDIGEAKTDLTYVGGEPVYASEQA
jgi:predicted amidohydrolase YtcJ